MKKLMILFAIGIISLASFGQSANHKTEVAAFKASYTNEAGEKYTEAINNLKEVYDAESYPLNLRIGWLYYINADYINSQKYYKIAMNINPNSVEAKFGYIYPMAAMANWDKVIELYKSILKQDPKNYQANINLASVYITKKKYNDALEYGLTCQKMFPFDYTTNLVLGKIYIHLGKITEAKSHLKQAHLFYPDSEEVINLLNGI